MIDFKYEDAISYGDPSATILVRTDALKPIKEAFFDHHMQIQALAQTPIFLAAVSGAWEMACLHAKQELTGSCFPRPEQIDPIRDRLSDTANKHLAQASSSDLFKRNVIDAAKGNLNQFLAIMGQAGEYGIRAIFNSMLVQSWTAFEVLCGDLWEAAINAHPGVLSDLKGNKRWKVAGGEQGDDESKKHVQIKFLQMHKYDLRDKMGTVLRERFSFSVLPSIRLAYSQAFSKDHDQIKAAIEHTSFDVLAAVRNAIVHKAGIADKEFRDTVKRLGIFVDVPVGGRIALDGGVLNSILKPAFANVIELFASVDQWIVDHDDKQQSPISGI